MYSHTRNTLFSIDVGMGKERWEEGEREGQMGGGGEGRTEEEIEG